MKYTTADFKSLPKAALDALGVGVVVKPGAILIGHTPNRPLKKRWYPHDHAAALLIGMVQAKCVYMMIWHDNNSLWRAQLSIDGGWLLPAVASTPLGAVMAAYADAVEGKYES